MPPLVLCGFTCIVFLPLRPSPPCPSPPCPSPPCPSPLCFSLLSFPILHLQFIIDPHNLQPSVDLIKNNPLSQEEEVRNVRYGCVCVGERESNCFCTVVYSNIPSPPLPSPPFPSRPLPPLPPLPCRVPGTSSSVMENCSAPFKLMWSGHFLMSCTSNRIM